MLHTDQADHLALRLREHGVRATALSGRIRFGFHYFNEELYIVATVRVLRGVGWDTTWRPRCQTAEMSGTPGR
ncbi:hypothetical protein ACGFNP_35025 [Nonomuraea sp. NPDC049269]|uniref:hypothetical protein n=1 Tax=Nonomuraea sp. NPDC049269 TaxID=3364349 RepID=UPI0037141278